MIAVCRLSLARVLQAKYNGVAQVTGHDRLIACKYGECLKGGQRISVIHGEHILANFPELQDDLVGIRLGWLSRRWGTSRRLSCSDQLEILDRGNGYPSPEIKTPTLQLLVPSQRFIPKY
nr:hypothetical protein Iba_chr14dCG16500 [Ipomoea batatas]